MELLSVSPGKHCIKQWGHPLLSQAWAVSVRLKVAFPSIAQESKRRLETQPRRAFGSEPGPVDRWGPRKFLGVSGEINEML